jgi:hypothetical protein
MRRLRRPSSAVRAGGAGADTIGQNAILIITAGICIATATSRKVSLDVQLIERSARRALKLVA